MALDHRQVLAGIKTFTQLITYLRDELGWPISKDPFDDADDLFYDFSAEELGIDPKTAAKIQEIKRLRPLSATQPWGIFFIKFEPKKLPIVALRRILSQVARKKRASANSSERAAWSADDLLFISNYGEGEERQISFAHFSQPNNPSNLPTLQVLGWNNLDTLLHLDAVAGQLTQNLRWPQDENDLIAWRKTWSSAFKLGHNEVIKTSKILAIRLAKLASDIRNRIKTALSIENVSGPLTSLMSSFQKTLVNDLDSDSFADMYAQTIAYGLLSNRIAEPNKKTNDDLAIHMHTNPFLRELMETFLKVGGRRNNINEVGMDFDELGVSEIVNLLDMADMEAVIRDFGDRNPQEDPVIHFYELFLKEYDAQKRLQRGVFYTPRSVVSCIVNSVDEVLRSEFGLVDGLADTTTWKEMAQRHTWMKIPEGVSPDHDFIKILDPATGTGTFIVEVIDLIHQNLLKKWNDQGHSSNKIDSLWNEYVPKHLLTRIHGYELLMAPYAIAHLKIGLKLFETGYRFSSNERARIYLTNALEAPHDFSKELQFAIPAIAHEVLAVNAVKKHANFTVVIGNPPYSHLSANLNSDQRDLVEVYKYVHGEKIKERGALQFELNIQDDYVKFIRIAELCIEKSNIGVVGLITNNAYLDSATFRGLRSHLLESYDSIKVLDLHGSVKAIREKGDENVFDIQQGVAITISSVFDGSRKGLISYSELVGSRGSKYKSLISKPLLNSHPDILPRPPGFLFIYRDESLAAEYESGLMIDKIFNLSSSGVKTNRDGLTIAHSNEQLIDRMNIFLDPSLSDAEVGIQLDVDDKKYWNIGNARKLLTKEEWVRSIQPIEYRPFDQRKIVYNDSIVFSPRKPVMVHLGNKKNLALLLCRQQIVPGFFHAFVTRGMFDCCLVSNRSRENTSGFPLYLTEPKKQESLFSDQEDICKPNLKSDVLDIFNQKVGSKDERKILNYIYAILYSPQFRHRYSKFLQRDFPRIPIPGTEKLFELLSALGEKLISLHLFESVIPNNLIPEFEGYPNVVVEKTSWSNNTIWLDKDEKIGFKGVPEAIWAFQIGSYKVCEKWLKDRKGMALSQHDIEHYQKVIVTLVMTVNITKEIDEVIDCYGSWPNAFLK